MNQLDRAHVGLNSESERVAAPSRLYRTIGRGRGYSPALGWWEEATSSPTSDHKLSSLTTAALGTGQDFSRVPVQAPTRGRILPSQAVQPMVQRFSEEESEPAQISPEGAEVTAPMEDAVPAVVRLGNPRATGNFVVDCVTGDSVSRC